MNRFFLTLLRSNLAIFTGCILVPVLIFAPLLNNGFAADDYYVMHRVGTEGNVLAEGFFRPLSDITLYLNYLIGGFDAFNYHLTNILLHGIAAYLLFRFCNKVSLFDATGHKRLVAMLAALLFVSYPFHSESIAWVVGRASLLAGLFGLASMLISVSDIKLIFAVIFSCLCYFTGLLAYESIFPLPAIVILVLWFNGTSKRILFIWGASYAMTLGAHFLMRIILAGVVTGNYGSEIFGSDILRYLNNAFKISGRLFLPPSDNSWLLVVGFGICILAFVWLKFIGRKSGVSVYEEIPMLMMLLFSLIVPFTFSVSTRTSEGDRLLYFPSAFSCILTAYIIVRYFRNANRRLLITGLILVYNISFVQMNNSHWRKASEVSERLIHQLNGLPSLNHVVVINAPGEYRGAYVFRGALEHAVLLQGLDTTDFRVINYLNHGESMMTPVTLHPKRIKDTTVFGPSVQLIRDTLIVRDFRLPHLPPQKWFISSHHQIWYWDKNELRPYRN